MKQAVFFTFLILGLSFVSCKKEKDNEPQPSGTSSGNTPPNCSLLSGSFEINMGGNQHSLQVNNQTHFTILYNWYEEQENNFVLIGEDQNNKSINIEGVLPETLSVGTHQFNSDGKNIEFFDIYLDTSSYYSSKLIINVVQSNLNLQEGMYKPIRATFEGVAHSYPWSSGQPPADTINYSGEFCLNAYIME